MSASSDNYCTVDLLCSGDEAIKGKRGDGVVG